MWPCITSLEADSTLRVARWAPGSFVWPHTRGLYPLGTWRHVCSLDAKDVDFSPSTGAADWKRVTGSI